MKSKLTLIVITTLLSAAACLAQSPPSPPAPPTPPLLPGNRHENMPKVPVTFLGVETSDVPRVVSEQLGLAKGFGLVVDYVVPDGPAAAGGLQANDILKMLNDQILTEPDQLSKLIRSYSEGTTVTLTVLRKGQEQKIPVKLGKKDVPQRHFGSHMPGDFKMGDFDLGEMRERMNDWKEDLRGSAQDMMQDTVMRAHEEVARARDEALRAGQEARDNGERARDNTQRMRDEMQRARDDSQRDKGQIKITKPDRLGLRTTSIDLARAQIVFSDDKGELRLDTNEGKRILTAKDPQGRLLFSGPIESKEDLDKIPAEVRDRFNKLQQKDLPSVASPQGREEDGDSEDTNDGDKGGGSVEQVSTQCLPHTFWAIGSSLV